MNAAPNETSGSWAEPDAADRRRSAPLAAEISRSKMILTALIAVQGLCAFFYLVDVVQDFMEGANEAHTALELMMTAALIAGVAAMSWQLRLTLRRQNRLESEIRAASGAFHDVLMEHFEDWGLTPAQRDVALLSLKGLSISEIAAARETAEGTVKAQLNAIYGKAGVSGRPQLLSVFIETLLGDGLARSAAASSSPPSGGASPASDLGASGLGASDPQADPAAGGADALRDSGAAPVQAAATGVSSRTSRRAGS